MFDHALRYWRHLPKTAPYINPLTYLLTYLLTTWRYCKTRYLLCQIGNSDSVYLCHLCFVLKHLNRPIFNFFIIAILLHHVCQVATVVTETAQLVLSQFNNF